MIPIAIAILTTICTYLIYITIRPYIFHNLDKNHKKELAELERIKKKIDKRKQEEIDKIHKMYSKK
jgi:hypothetical protein